MYVMLCGYPPFNGSNDEEILEKSASCQYAFPDSEWSGVSDLAKELISQILVLDTKKRLSA
jgi:calcium-dependent protein kinase